MSTVCPLCGFMIGEHCDGTEASHDGDGHEPCENGHYDCSTSGRTGGPCGARVPCYECSHGLRCIEHH